MLEKLIELEQNDIIEKIEGRMTWVSPLVIVPKRNSDICVFVDMRIANQVIQRERCPIPTVKETAQEMSGAFHFSKLDLYSGYHQLELDAVLREITTFLTPLVLHRQKRLALGITSSSQYYQETLERKTFYDLQNARNILDNVIIWEKSQREYDFYLEKALKRVREHRLTLNRKKRLS